MTTPSLIDVVSGRTIPLDGGREAQNALLAGILVEMRVQSYFLQAVASGQVVTDDPACVRADMASDPTLIVQR